MISTQIMDKTKERAHEIINIYISAAKDMGFIKSIILVGSLSDDTYTGNAGSDIDLVHIVSDEIDYRFEKKAIVHLIERIESQTNHDIPISKVVFQEQHLKHPYKYDFEINQQNKDLVERPIEIFRIIDSGITLMGDPSIIDSIERPTREDVLETKRLGKKQIEILRQEDPVFYMEYKNTSQNPSIRMMTQIVLTTALSDYFFYTNKSCSSKYYILQRIENDLPELPYLNLLRLCHKNRFTPEQITETDIAAMKEEYQSIFLKRPKTWMC